jgi:hypothetical protein
MVPEAMRLLTITSKIGMMKDRPLIDSVCHKDKGIREKCHQKLYRIIKLARRQLFRGQLGAERERLKEYMTEHLRECFLWYIQKDTDYVELKDLEDLVRSCGFDLEENEMRTLAKHCTNEEYQITFQAFCQAVEAYISEVKQDPQILVQNTMKKFYGQVYGDEGNIREVTM